MSNFKNITTTQLVQQFLEQGKESEYWDFKQEWHDKISDLYKDIICFANTVHDDNCYLVFGISDDLQITGMKKERRKQADIIEGISKLHFAGDNYPKISVETITLKGIDLDVLIIFNTNKTPIFLKEPHGKMRMGCIYSRVEDKNTPDNGNADIMIIEDLWRKRFDLKKTPLEYIFIHMGNKHEWEKKGDSHFNIYQPEYTIEMVCNNDENDATEFYSYAMCNEKTIFQTCNIKYQQTILETFQIVILDSGRLKIPVPKWGFICRDKNKITNKSGYKYYVVGNKQYQLLTFLYDQNNGEELYAFKDFKEVILFFESDNERIEFEKYIEDHQDLLHNQLKTIQRYEHINTGDQKLTSFYIEQLQIGFVLNKLLDEWRKTKKLFNHS
jgi:hypothetical protein